MTVSTINSKKLLHSENSNALHCLKRISFVHLHALSNKFGIYDYDNKSEKPATEQEDNNRVWDHDCSLWDQDEAV